MHDMSVEPFTGNDYRGIVATVRVRSCFCSPAGLQDPLLNSNSNQKIHHQDLKARSASQFASRLIPACELKEFGSVYGRTTDPGLSSELRPMSSVATGTPADFTTQPAILDFQRGMNVATFAGHWHAF